MAHDSEHKPNRPSRSGPLLIWTAAVAAAGFLYGCLANLFREDGRDYWYLDAVYLACSGAAVGVVVGLVVDVMRRR